MNDRETDNMKSLSRSENKIQNNSNEFYNTNNIHSNINRQMALCK